MSQVNWSSGGADRCRFGPLLNKLWIKRRTFKGYRKSKKDIIGGERIMGWEGKCRREGERMSRARGARIIGQADTLAVSSVGGPAAVQPTLRGPLVSLSLFLLVGISAVSEFAVAE
jgi:hypothetical protein